MANEHLSELLRNANPVTREPTRPMDAAWDEIVIGHQSVRMSTARPRKHATSMWTHPRRLSVVAFERLRSRFWSGKCECGNRRWLFDRACDAAGLPSFDVPYQ